MTRRGFVAASAGAGFAMAQSRRAVPLFDGKTLNGWTQVENGWTSLAASGIADVPAFVKRVSAGPDAVSVYLRSRLPEGLKTDLAAYSPAAEGAAKVVSALAREISGMLGAAPIHEAERFRGVALRAETKALLSKHSGAYELARLNKLLLEDAYPAELAKAAPSGWVVKDGAMASTGAGRGVIYTDQDYGRFRLMFTMRHVLGNPDHHAGILIFCARPQPGEKPLDALAGIQFQVPLGGRWDYRAGPEQRRRGAVPPAGAAPVRCARVEPD